METTITALFATADAAQRARRELEAAGFSKEHTMVITEQTEHRHELLGEETSDAVRGARLGAIVGAIGMGLGGAALTLPALSVFQGNPLVAAIYGAIAGGCTGGLIGLLVGSATGHQVQEEYEHGIEDGGVVLAVNTDGPHSAKALEVLTRTGGTSLSTSVHAKHHDARQYST
jgi:hypothetical protein